MKKSLAFLISLTILGSLFSSSAFGAVKAGANCSKLGATSIVANIKYTCVKAAKKLIWNSGFPVKPVKTSPTTEKPKPQVNPIANDSPIKTMYNSPVDTCKLKDLRQGSNQGLGAGAVGFPMSYNKMKPNGLIKVAIIPIDFPGSPKVSSPESYLKKPLDSVNQRNLYFYGTRIQYEWTVLPDWLVMPKKAEYFASDHSTVQADGSRKSDGVNQILSTDEQLKMIFSAAEKRVDLKSFDFIWIFTNPLEVKVPQGPVGGDSRQTIQTETSQYNLNFYALGNRIYSGEWMLWGIKGSSLEDTIAHEMAHYHGLIQHAPGNGWGWYISNNPTWEAWLAGWRPDSEYVCFDVKENWNSVDFDLSAIDLNSTGFKSAVIKLSDSKALVVESRRGGPFTTALPKNIAGITVYLVDTKKSGERWDGNLERENDYYLAFLRIKGTTHPVPKNSNLAVWDENIIAYQGDSFEFENVRIELIKSSGYDSIKVSKF